MKQITKGNSVIDYYSCPLFLKVYYYTVFMSGFNITFHLEFSTLFNENFNCFKISLM